MTEPKEPEPMSGISDPRRQAACSTCGRILTLAALKRTTETAIACFCGGSAPLAEAHAVTCDWQTSYGTGTGDTTCGAERAADEPYCTEHMADLVDNYGGLVNGQTWRLDESSSMARQHYIDTGRYPYVVAP